MVSRWAMVVKSCANPGQLGWQRVVKSLAMRKKFKGAMTLS
jgi:hypothetical protein